MRGSIVLLAVMLGACTGTGSMERTESAAPQAENTRLAAVLAAQPADKQARYAYRHPRETLEFFGITPGMTVVEVLPGAGWYSQILADYLGPEGHLIGVDYAYSMWPKFGFFGDEFIAAKKTWPQDWTAEAAEWSSDESAVVSAFVFGAMPDRHAGTADAVLMIRAMHNLHRFENDGGYLRQALADAYRVLKPGGIVGIVQHHARDDMPDAWADGSRGYLKKSAVIAAMRDAGFEYLGESAINENPADRPMADDIVWRLPPTLVTSRENPQLRERMTAIGESNRMTLKFRKPM